MMAHPAVHTLVLITGETESFVALSAGVKCYCSIVSSLIYGSRDKYWLSPAASSSRPLSAFSQITLINATK